jgi:biotin carboxyl carrier protein
MIVRLTLGDETFEVEVGPLDARPITATVEGEQFEFWPPSSSAAAPVPAAASPTSPRPTSPSAATPQPATSPPAENGDNAIRAPLPGVIVSVAVKAGEAVAVGQEVCALEAMKMKNAIRATRAGVIARVHVAPGQAVRHRDLLAEYA